MTNPYVIQTNDLSKTYDGVDALIGLSLGVPKNSIFGFLGPNGAGKTTTMKLLLGLIWPSSGTGTVFGLDIVKDSVQIRSRIGYLPQEPRFYEHMSARQTLDFTARFFFSGPENQIKERVEETLELVGLQDKADRPIKGFSGGERQRLGIGQAQVNYPDLLILDEPAASLDPFGRKDVLQVMERLRKYTTIFYSTHILDDVQQVSDTVAILNHGQMVAYGPIEELLMGSGGVAYRVTLKGGDLVTARAQLETLDWVTEVQVTGGEEETGWIVAVSDADIAEEQLLRLLLSDEQRVVTEFKRREYELEEIFFDIVKGGTNGR